MIILYLNIFILAIPLSSSPYVGELIFINITELFYNMFQINPMNDFTDILFIIFSKIAGKSTNYWANVVEKDNFMSETKNPHLIAARIIREGGFITNSSLNQVLAHQGYSINSTEFHNLKNISFKAYNLALPKEIQTFKKELMERPNKITTSIIGVYILINNLTGIYYVGSSVVMEKRLNHYFKPYHNKVNLRPILVDIRSTGILNFTVRIYKLPSDIRELRLSLALEQYYILKLNPKNNVLLVAAGSPGGMRNSELLSQKIYMYRNNILIHIFDSLNAQANNNASILAKTIYRKVDRDTPYLGEFKLTREPYSDIVDPQHIIELSDVLKLVNKVRTQFIDHQIKNLSKNSVGRRSSSTTSSVKVTCITDNTVQIYPNFWATRVAIKKLTGKGITNDLIVRRIKSKIPLNGYRYESAENAIL